MKSRPCLIAHIVLALCLALMPSASLAADDVLRQPDNCSEYVNPLIGTDNHGHVAVGGGVPFGMANPGPVEVGEGWDWCSGYNWADSEILGFSPLHISGPGCRDLGDILLMPVSGSVSKAHGEAGKPETGHFSSFSHANETARAGYYSVLLDRWNILAEMTATSRVSWLRFSWPADCRDQRVIIDLRNAIGDVATDCEIHQADSRTVVGHRTSKGWSPRHTVYFAAEFSRPIAAWSVYEDNQLQPGKALHSTRAFGEAAFGGDEKQLVVFGGDEKQLVVKLAISAVSADNALANLRSESAGMDSFEQVRDSAQQAWNKWLGAVDAEFCDPKHKTIFYTALYHMMLQPIACSDADGSYMGADRTAHRDSTAATYTIWSCWDTYRTYHPLATLLLPQMQKDWAATLLKISREQGFLPIWHLMSTETYTMVGMSAVPILADMLLKGFVSPDKQEEAYLALKKTMMSNYLGLDDMKKLGYVSNRLDQSVSLTMEYCLDDWCVAQAAKMLGHTKDYEYFTKRSLGYKRLYDSQTGFMRSLDQQGNFQSAQGFRPNIQTRDYTEGNPWQYLWLAPHDVGGLKELLGGDKAFAARLDSLFSADEDLGDNYTPDIAGLIGQYAHGNEPSHHIAYLYNYAGRQDKTAAMVRRIMTTLYDDTPGGLAGNEDCGQMSAWFVSSALGLYQVEPCGGRYQFGSPLVKRASFTTATGKTFTIVAHNNSSQNLYIRKVKLNGKPYKKNYIDFSDIQRGGTLEFFMDSQPSHTR